MSKNNADPSAPNLYLDDPYKELMRAILRKAAEDVTSPSAYWDERVQAANWLQCFEAGAYCDAVGLRRDIVQKWAKRMQRRMGLYYDAKR